MSCGCNKTNLQGTQYCQECMPSEFHWLVPVSKEPDPFLMDRNHAYIGPNNIIYVLSRDRVRAIKITTSEGNIDLSPYALKEELASKISELTTKLAEGLEGAKYFEGEGIRIDEDNRIHSTVTLTEVNKRLDSLEQVDTSPYKAGTGIEITPDLTIKSTVDVSGLDSRVQDLEEQEDKDTKYTAGAGLQLNGTEFSVNPNDLPGTDQLVDINTRVTALENDTDADTKYTAGTNVQISGSNVISATDTKYTAGTNVQISGSNVISATDTKYTAGAGLNLNSNILSLKATSYSIGLGFTYTNPFITIGFINQGQEDVNTGTVTHTVRFSSTVNGRRCKNTLVINPINLSIYKHSSGLTSTSGDFTFTFPSTGQESFYNSSTSGKVLIVTEIVV